MNQGVLSLIGHTPLIRLEKIFKDSHFLFYAKFEAINPGGSIKDRTALHMITQAMKKGLIKPDTVVIESSSGNMGIGLAQVCAFFGLQFICVVDPMATKQNLDIMRAYGATISLVTEPDPTTNAFLTARLNRVRALRAEIPMSYWPDQYSNLDNPTAHHQTMHEIMTEMGGAVDFIFVATSTCGTMRGCAEYLRQHQLPTKIIAVDAVGSIIFGGVKSERLIPGHGAAVVPPLFHSDLTNEFINVTDLDCVVGCRRLVSEEAILAGGSSGAVVMGVKHLEQRIPTGATCVGIFADRGERYLDTIYSDDWVEKHFGDVSSLWEDHEKKREGELCLATTY